MAFLAAGSVVLLATFLAVDFVVGAFLAAFLADLVAGAFAPGVRFACAVLARSRRTTVELLGASRSVVTALSPSLRIAATSFSPRSASSA